MVSFRKRSVQALSREGGSSQEGKRRVLEGKCAQAIFIFIFHLKVLIGN